MELSNILIVEDEYITALDINSRLANFGTYECKMVDSGEDAIKLAQHEKFDLIIMDIRLKGEIDGIEAARKIVINQNTPIVFMSGNSDLLKSERLKKTKPLAVITKPVSDWDLHELIISYKKRKDFTINA